MAHRLNLSTVYSRKPYYTVNSDNLSMYWCKCSYMKTCWICHTFIIKFCHCTTHYQWYKCCAAYTMDLPINPLKILSKKCYMKVKPSSFMITSFHAKWHLSERNECRNSILMTCHYPCHFCWRSRTGQSKFPLWHNPVKSQKYCVSQIMVVIRYHYDISGLVPQTSFCGETSGGIAKCQLITLIQK